MYVHGGTSTTSYYVNQLVCTVGVVAMYVHGSTSTSTTSYYVNQLVCAVGGVLVFVAKSEWRGGEQKMEKVEFDMPTLLTSTSY